MTTVAESPFRALPAVDEIARAPELTALGLRPEILRDAIRVELARLRDDLHRTGHGQTARDALRRTIIERVVEGWAAVQPDVINATGILIHTNLGRVPVSEATAEAMRRAAASPVELEVDADTGERGDRQRRVGHLLRSLTGAESALAVNNNAAAVLLAVAALAAGREVIVSRGEAVEIGGGFRIPEVLQQGGARLIEVGTTNRTYAGDYADAIGPETAMLLKVHPGNFVMSGFTHAPSTADLARVAADTGIPLVEDQGDGLLIDGLLEGERSVVSCLRAGADLVMASGDKLLGGPQCGMLLGRAELVARLARHPLARAVRVDKVTLAGLEATLRHYARGEERTAIPLWRMATMPVDVVRRRAQEVVEAVGGSAMVVEVDSRFGGGAAPGRTVPSAGVSIGHTSWSPDELARRLRLASPSVWGRIVDDQLMLDMRTVPPDRDRDIAEVVRSILRG